MQHVTTFMNGDCLKELIKVKDKTVDLVLCDLPYGMTSNKWDTCIDLDRLWEHYKRIVKDNGAIVLFGMQPFTSKLITSNTDMFKYTWVWEKNIGRGWLKAKVQPMRNVEDICVFYRKQCVYNPQMTEGKPYSHAGGGVSVLNCYGSRKQVKAPIENKGTRYPKQVLRFSTVPQKQVVHPTQKPVELLTYLIETYSKPGAVVLDNCMGSGSTGVACVQTQRRFIGIELDKNYFESAKAWIEQALTSRDPTPSKKRKRESRQ